MGNRLEIFYKMLMENLKDEGFKLRDTSSIKYPCEILADYSAEFGVIKQSIVHLDDKIYERRIGYLKMMSLEEFSRLYDKVLVKDYFGDFDLDLSKKRANEEFMYDEISSNSEDFTSYVLSGQKSSRQRKIWLKLCSSTLDSYFQSE